MNALGFAQASASGAGSGDWALWVGNGGAGVCGGPHCDADDCPSEPAAPPLFLLSRIPNADSPITVHDYRHIRYS
ncbi:hypothetical protein FHY19_002047 [Xanthomonas arboricola]|nr:hypothetical protein [Xanthomonas sp. 4461]